MKYVQCILCKNKRYFIVKYLPSNIAKEGLPAVIINNNNIEEWIVEKIGNKLYDLNPDLKTAFL